MRVRSCTGVSEMTAASRRQDGQAVRGGGVRRRWGRVWVCEDAGRCEEGR